MPDLNLQDHIKLQYNPVEALKYWVAQFAFLLVYSVVLVAFIDGFSIERVGFTRIETSYFAALLITLLMWWFLSKISLLWLSYLLFLLACLWLGSVITGSGLPRLLDDSRYFLRSYVLGVLVFLYFQSLDSRMFNARKFFSMQWGLIALLVLIHFLTGFGGVIGRGGVYKPMYSSFFQEGNVIAFVFVIAWFYLYTNTDSTKCKVGLTVLTLLIGGLLSSKAAVLCIPLLLVFHWVSYFKASSRGKAILANFVIWAAAIGFIGFFYELMDLLIRLLIVLFPDGAVMLYRLDSWDVLTVLTSTRDLRVIELFSDMQHYSVGELLFGIGFKSVLEAHKLIESDIFDILQAFGIVGVMVFCFPVLAIFWIIKKDRVVRSRNFSHYVFTLGALYATLFVSTATGHILLTPTAMILLGVVFGYFISERRHHNPGRRWGD